MYYTVPFLLTFRDGYKLSYTAIGSPDREADPVWVRPLIAGVVGAPESAIVSCVPDPNPGTVAVTFESGAVRTFSRTDRRIPGLAPTNVVGVDQYRDTVVPLWEGAPENMVCALTSCCDATGKGAEDGIVCRACYRDVSPDYGGTTRVADPAVLLTFAHDDPWYRIAR